MPEFFRAWLDRLPAGATDLMLEWVDDTDRDTIVEEIKETLNNNPT